MNNVFTLLGIADSEVHLCRLLQRLLECAAVPRDALVAALLGEALAAPVDRLSVRVEVPFGGAGKRRRADLVIHWIDAAGVSAQLLIEAKLFAGEGDDQTRDYVAAQPDWDRLRAEFLASAGVDARRNEATRFVFLSLFGEPAVAPAMRPVALFDLVPALRGYAGHGTLGRLATDFVEVLESSVDIAAPSSARSFAEQLRDCEGAPLDARYLLFRHVGDAVAAKVRSPSSFRCLTHYRTAARARSWFGAQLGCPHWRNESSARRVLADFDPRRDFWLHFQITLDLSRRSHAMPAFELGYYDELLPYLSKKDFRSSLAKTPERVDAHERLRKARVQRAVEALRPLGWVPKGRSNQVAAWPARIDLDAPLEALAERLAPTIAAAATRIETALGPLMPITTPPR